MTTANVTKDQIAYYIGSDNLSSDNLLDLLTEIANGEYGALHFKKDIYEHYTNNSDLNPKEVYDRHHAWRESIPQFEYIHDEGIGNGVFYIARLKDDRLLFIYKDKHSIFNVFPTMGDYTAYCEGDLNGCQRVCIDDEYIEEGEPGYEEGVDALDRYLRSLP